MKELVGELVIELIVIDTSLDDLHSPHSLKRLLQTSVGKTKNFLQQVHTELPTNDRGHMRLGSEFIQLIDTARQ